MDKIQIADIKIGERRREDLGDITALAQSIERYGLLAPPILTDDGTLVAGQRRIEAMKLLGWTETPYISKGLLTQAQLHEIELEENIRRKDFTEYETSKNMVALAEIVGKRLVEESEFHPKLGRNTSRGRPEKPDGLSSIANEVGVPRSTISDARTHVAAVEAYPILEQAPKMKAISIAKQANKLPENQRESFTAEQVDELRRGGKKAISPSNPSNVIAFPSQASVQNAIPEPIMLSEIEAAAAADNRAYQLTKDYTKTICSVAQLDTTPDAVREWIGFSRMNRDEIQGALTDVQFAINRLVQLEKTLSGFLSPRLVKE